MCNFSIGDVVINRDNGVKMTIHSCKNKSDSYDCVWFDDNIFKSSTFKLNQITSIDCWEREILKKERNLKINKILNI